MKPVHIHVHNHATRDAWEESKHPRADDGKFGSGGGGSSSGSDKGGNGGKEGGGSSESKGAAPKAKKGEAHFKEAKDKQGRTIYQLYDKGGQQVGSAASKSEANRWWADHGGKKAEAAYDRGESGLRT